MSFWTASADAAARALWLRGYSAREVARAIDAPSASAVVGRLWRLGVTRGAGRGRPRSGNARNLDRAFATPETSDAWRALSPESHPRPWLTRGAGECAFPVDGEGFQARSCCNPTRGGAYCPQHRAIVFANPLAAKA